jgi:hypothetical protein
VNETIIVQVRNGTGKWVERQRIEDRYIREFGITPQQVIEYVQAHPSPLARLFRPTPEEYRVLYRVCEQEEVARFRAEAEGQ